MIASPTIKHAVKNIKGFKFPDNQTQDPRLITSYMNMKGYIKNPKRPCTFQRMHFASRRDVERVLPDTGCKVKFINCGQGEACLIESCGKYALIDFGGEVGAVKNYLDQTLKGKTLDYAFITHFHYDHTADLAQVLDEYKVKELVMVKNYCVSSRRYTSAQMRKAFGFFKMFEKHCKASTVTMLEIGKCLHEHSHNFKLGKVEFEYLGPTEEANNLNDNSIVLKCSYKGKTILFTGDISKAGETRVMEYCKRHDIDLGSVVLKVAHHGAQDSISKEFLEEVSPQVAVICCKEKNKYQHPSMTIMEILDEKAVDIQFTHWDKSINIEITPEGKLKGNHMASRNEKDMIS